jgi:hypothetical protein
MRMTIPIVSDDQPRPRPKALRFFVQGPQDQLSFNLSMLTQDIQSAILVPRSHSSGFSIKLVGQDGECERANQVCQKISEERYNRAGHIQAAIERVVFYLVFRGRALFELVRDADDAVAEVISFLPDRVWILLGNYVQVAPRDSWSQLEKKYVVLKGRDVWRVEIPQQLGGYRKYRRLLAQISTWPSLGPEFQRRDLEQGKWPRDFVIGDYMREYFAQRYRVTRKWGWDTRDWNSQYITEYYQFYRLLTFRWSIEILRRHVVQETNRFLRRLGIEAFITIDGLPTPESILDARERMAKGEIDFAAASKLTSTR